MKRKIVIVGAGFAGLNCARELANDSRFEVVLIDRQNHHLFQPLLYQVATAALAAPDIARSLRAILARAKNVSVILDDVSSIDTEKRLVIGQAGEYTYDRLILAMGARTSFFGNDEWSRHVHGLKSLEDAREIRHKVLHALEKAEICPHEKERQRLMTVVIVGGGPTGVELAGAFSDLVRRALKTDFRHIDPAEMRVILIQSGDRILKPFDADHSEYGAERLRELGVELILGPRVDEVKAGRVHLNDERWIEAETIIWAAGVQANRLCEQIPCKKDGAGRLCVMPDLSLPEDRSIFAAGDLVDLTDSNGVQVPGLAPAAMQMGKHIAKVLKEDERLKKTRYAERAEEFRSVFRYRDKGIMAIIGKNKAVAKANGMKLKGFPAWFAWLFIHLAFLVGFRNKLAVMLSWAFTYLFDKPGARVFSVEEERER